MRKVIQAHLIATGSGNYIQCDMEDSSVWQYHKGAEKEWIQILPTIEELTKLFNAKIL